jgi:hypothetical protein
MALPLTVQFNTHDEADTPVFEQGDNWENNIVWDSTRTVPQANYQGQRVNFSQTLGLDQISAIITQDIIPRLNKIQIEYPQDKFSASAKSDTDLWNNINRYIWGKSGEESSPKGDWQANPNAIFPRVQKNEANILTMGKMSNDLQRQLNEAKDERDSIQAKLKGKAMVNHTHNNGGGDDCGWFGEKCNGKSNGNGKDCGWFGEKCWDFDLGLGSSLTTMAAIGVGAYLLLKKK